MAFGLLFVHHWCLVKWHEQEASFFVFFLKFCCWFFLYWFLVFVVQLLQRKSIKKQCPLIIIYLFVWIIDVRHALHFVNRMFFLCVCVCVDISINETMCVVLFCRMWLKKWSAEARNQWTKSQNRKNFTKSI